MALRKFIAAVSVTVALGRRVQSGSQTQLAVDQAPAAKKLFASSDSSLCGGSTIRQFLKAPESVTEVRSIPWSQVESIADDFLRTQAQQIAQLQAQVDQLNVEIPLREKREALKPLATDAITRSVVEAVKVFGPNDAVKASKCGAVAVRPRPPANAFESAVAAFEAQVNTLLQDGSTVAVSETVRTTCEAALGFKAGDGKSSCGELCQQFATAAQKASDKKAGALALGGKPSDQMRRELEQRVALLKSAVTELDQCKQLKADMAIFRTQLENLQEDVKDKHSKLMGAKNSLIDAQYDMMDAQDALDGQRLVADKVSGLFSDASKAADDAVNKFQAVTARSQAARATMEASAAQLQMAQADLQSAKAVTDLVNGLKGAVSDSMLKMLLFFDEGVRKPIRDLGLAEQVDVDTVFPRNTPQLATAQDLGKSLQTLASFCASPQTQQALAAVSSKDRDVSVLCAVGNPTELAQDIDAKLGERILGLKDRLRDVQSWLLPFRGQASMTAAVAADLVKQGEPSGLREVLSVFGKTSFYQRYLQQWQLKGRFLELYGRLQAAVGQAEITHASATAKLREVTADLKKTEQAVSEAQAALKQAVDSKAVAQSKQQEAQQVLSAMQADAQKLQDKLALLEAAVAEAERRWNAAKLTMEQTHKEGVSLIQILEELEGAMPM